MGDSDDDTAGHGEGGRKHGSNDNATPPVPATILKESSSKFLKKKDSFKRGSDHSSHASSYNIPPLSMNSRHSDEEVASYGGTPRPAIDVPNGNVSHMHGFGNYGQHQQQQQQGKNTYMVSFTAAGQGQGQQSPYPASPQTERKASKVNKHIS